jgi:hypothetical protein
MSFTCQCDCLSQVPRRFYASRSRSVASTARGCKFKGGARPGATLGMKFALHGVSQGTNFLLGLA